MPLTKDQIIDRLARRLVDDRIDGLTWAQLVLAVQGITAEQKAALLAAVQARATTQVGEQIRDAIQTWARAQAKADATTMLAGDALSLADLEKILRS